MDLSQLTFDIANVSKSKKYYTKQGHEITFEFHPEPQNLKYPENLPQIKGSQLMTLKEIDLWIISLVNSMSLSSINGAILSSGVSYCCDTCNGNIPDEATYYYCFDCFQDICQKCYNTKDENEKNVLNVPTKLCAESHNIQLRHYTYRVWCNICNALIVDEFKFTNKPFIPSHWETYDVCMTCSETDEGVGFIQEKGLIKTSNFLQCDDTGYGNIADWIPIYRESRVTEKLTKYPAYSVLCINCNKESPHFGKTSIAIVTLNFYSSYVSIISFDKSIDELAKEINLFMSQKQLESNGSTYEYNDGDEFDSSIVFDSSDISDNNKVFLTFFESKYHNER